MIHVGLVGFEPTACRRGDRSMPLIEPISTSPGLVVSFALCCFPTSGKAFAVDEYPGQSIFGCLGLTGVIAANSLG